MSLKMKREFCGSEFWDSSLTWDTQNPDFTTCFQQTVLVWVPCGFLWLFSALEAFFLLRSKKKYLPWTWINVTKLALAVILCILSAVEMGGALHAYFNKEIVFPVDYYTPFIKLCSFVLVLILMLLGQKQGLHTSGVFFIFWLLLSIGALVNYRSVLQKTWSENIQYVEDEFSYILLMIYFPVVIAEFILSCFSDFRAPPDIKTVKKKPCPEEKASFLSRITFWWFNPMAVMGFRRPLVQDDMWNLKEEHQTRSLASRFDKQWKKAEKRVSGKIMRLPAGSISQEQKERAKLSVLCPLIKTFWTDLLIAAGMKLASSLLIFVNPLLLDMLIAFITNDEPYWRGFFYVALMFFSSMLESIFNSQHEFRMYVIGMQMRSCLISAIYRKSLVLSSFARRSFTIGEIVNLMSVDTQRVMDYVQIANLLWSAPLQIIIALYLLWGQLGISTLGGLAVMIMMFPLNAYVTAKMRLSQVRLMKAKDRRIKIINEILNGMKILKLYAWEKSFQEHIESIRSLEIKDLKVQAYLGGVITFAFTSAPFLVALASFAMYVLISPDNVLDPNRAFVSLSLFNVLRVPLALLPMLISFGAMFFVSLGRINKYLGGGELDEHAVNHEDFEDPVVIEDATFAWSKDDPPVLRDISLQIKKGSLVAIVGSVGSGKSSLLSALLGDMEKLSGRINVYGSIAYVPQQAWIQNATVRSNILFLKPYDEALYEKVLDACALSPDLKVLAGGDMTEIGEKGINLSGGQKQRVSLARAVYADPDILILDDPLSAVDAHVGKHIFENVIGPKSITKNKTRILVTHRITILPQVDCIVVMKDGTITEIGSYAELLSRRGDFADFLLQFLTKEDEIDAITPDELQLMEELVAVVGPTPELQRHLSRLSSAESDGQLSDVEKNLRKRTMSMRSSISTASVDAVRRQRVSELQSRKKMTKLTEVETAEVGSVKWAVYFDYLKAVGLLGAIITILSYILSHAFTVASSIWLSDWSNDGLDPEKAYDITLRNLRLGVYGALGAGETVFILVASLSLNLAALQGSRFLHSEMLVRILQAPMSFFDTTPLGRILNRFSKDIDTIDITIRFNLRMLLVQFFRALVAFILISMETPVFLVAVLPLGILYYIVQKFYISTSRQLKRMESITRSPIYINFSETVAGASSIRAYGAAHQFINLSDNLVDINHKSYFPSLAASRWLAIRLEFLGYTIVFLAALFAVLTRDTLSPGIVGLSVSYAMTVTSTLNMLVRASADVETNIVSVERCLEYTHTPVEAPRHIEGREPSPDWPSEGHIEFKNYSTRYREGLDLVLKAISCDIRPGEKIGIVGRTGAGKSSLTLALFRLTEAVEGCITIDDVEISKIGLHDLRSKITVIPQDPVLFTGTLRMNLDPFDKFTDKEVWTALEQAHLKSFIVSLDDGLQHEVSEGGENLSVGQRQLICLARALLRKTKILVLDEATAAIDLETDELIQQTIRREFADCTILTIAHRLNTIMDYDRIMVLDDGKIVEFDTAPSLLENNKSIFYSMAKDAGLV